MRIGVTHTSSAPTLQSIDVCACRDESVGSGVTEIVHCGKTGRYLVVILEGTREILTLCEVEVYTGSSFEVIPRVARTLPLHTAATWRCSLHTLTPEQRQTSFQCLMRCVDNSCCKGVNITSCYLFYSQHGNIELVVV